MSGLEEVGGQEGVRRLVDRFYFWMDHLPEAATIRALHDDDLTADRHKLTAFLSGWLGGRPLYWEHWDTPRIRARHAHLPVDAAAVGAWMACMRAALAEVVADDHVRAKLIGRFAEVADAVRNR